MIQILFFLATSLIISGNGFHSLTLFPGDDLSVIHKNKTKIFLFSDVELSKSDVIIGNMSVDVLPSFHGISAKEDIKILPKKNTLILIWIMPENICNSNAFVLFDKEAYSLQLETSSYSNKNICGFSPFVENPRKTVKVSFGSRYFSSTLFSESLTDPEIKTNRYETVKVSKSFFIQFSSLYSQSDLKMAAVFPKKFTPVVDCMKNFILECTRNGCENDFDWVSSFKFTCGLSTWDKYLGLWIFLITSSSLLIVVTPIVLCSVYCKCCKCCKCNKHIKGDELINYEQKQVNLYQYPIIK